MSLQIDNARIEDIDELMPLVRQFYATFQYPFSDASKKRALSQIVRDPLLGWIWVARRGSSIIGYVVATLSFSLEQDGTVAFVDEIFVDPACRGSGAGRALLEHTAQSCRGMGVRALRLEIESGNAAAKELCLHRGYEAAGREVFIRWLDREVAT